MKLSLEQIRALTSGAVAIEQKSDGIHFYKCTKKQIEAWTRQSTGLGERAETTTGICLDFHTDAKALSFAAVCGNKFELYIDGLLRHQFLSEGAQTHRFELCDALGNAQTEYRVTLVLPSHDFGILQWIELEGATTVTKHAYDRKMLFIGDSITQGWNTQYDSLSYAWRVSRHFNADRVIQGIGGAYYHESTHDTLPFDPDVVLVAYGTNDFGHYASLEELRGHTSAYLASIKEEYSDKQIFVISPIWRGHREGKKMGSFEDCRATIAEEAIRLGLTHINGLRLVPPFPTLFADEYLHPNDEGFAIYAENLIIELEKHLLK